MWRMDKYLRRLDVSCRQHFRMWLAVSKGSMYSSMPQQQPGWPACCCGRIWGTCNVSTLPPLNSLLSLPLPLSLPACLQAALVVADRHQSLQITGNGDVLEPHDGIIAIGSGSPYALAAARALIDQPNMDALAIGQAVLCFAVLYCHAVWCMLPSAAC
jgi:hypothetical protein